MFNRTITGLGLSAVLTAFSLTAAQAQTTLEVLHAWPGDASNYAPLAEAFMKAHPDVKVEFRVPPTDYDEAHLTVARNAISGNLPDVYFSGYSVLRPLVGTLLPREEAIALTPFIEAEGDAWLKENYEPAVLALGQVDGIQYGIPFNASTPIVYYNADLVKQAGGDPDNFPADWDGLIDLAQKIDALGEDIDGTNHSVGSIGGDWFWQAAILERGGQMVTADETAVGYDNELGLETLKFLRHLAEATDMEVANTPDSYRQQFFAGKLGFFITSPSAVRSFSETVGDRFAMRTAKYPLADKENGGLPTGGNAATILAQDPETQAIAWEFIKFATGPEYQAFVAEKTGYLPTNRKAAEILKPFYDENPNYRTVTEQVGHARPWYGYPGPNGVEIWRAQREVIGLVQRGEISPEDGLKRISAETADLLN